MRRTLPLLLAASALMAAAPAPRLTVDRPEIRPTLGGLGTTAAYFTVRNLGTQPDTLTGAACACAASTSVHRSETRNGVSRMAPAGPVVVAPGGQVALQPGGLHLMLTGLKQPIAAGDSVRITLTFARAGKVEAVFKASPAAGMAGGMDHSAHMRHGG